MLISYLYGSYILYFVHLILLHIIMKMPFLIIKMPSVILYTCFPIPIIWGRNVSPIIKVSTLNSCKMVEIYWSCYCWVILDNSTFYPVAHKYREASKQTNKQTQTNKQNPKRYKLQHHLLRVSKMKRTLYIFLSLRSFCVWRNSLCGRNSFPE